MRLVWIVTLLAAVLVVLFVVSNTSAVAIGLWPFDARLVLPLSVAVLAIAAVAFLFGAAITWFAGMPHRAKARRLERSVEVLQAEVGTLKDSLARAEARRPAAPHTPASTELALR
ncbi:LapA family protein [Elioraea sp.]|uniref:LapA family protein n=1 Tax=Elioraea sp. TaxID=2185103 RepID=UPI003F6E7C62